MLLTPLLEHSSFFPHWWMYTFENIYFMIIIIPLLIGLLNLHKRLLYCVPPIGIFKKWWLNEDALFKALTMCVAGILSCPTDFSLISRSDGFCFRKGFFYHRGSHLGLSADYGAKLRFIDFTWSRSASLDSWSPRDILYYCYISVQRVGRSGHAPWAGSGRSSSIFVVSFVLATSL